ncbi:MAG: DUF542 domain-containing protein, partial [Pirellulaceae bacterium]
MKSFLPFVVTCLAIPCCLIFASCNQISASGGIANSVEVTNNQQESGNDETSVDSRPRHQWTTETSVGQIVADRNSTSKIFELVGIDYCCGGQKALGEAASENEIDVNQLLGALMV